MLMKKPDKTKTERMKALRLIATKHAKDVATKGGSSRLGFGKDFTEEELAIYRIPLGVPEIDTFLGGGFPTSTFTVAGEASVGKTTLMLFLIAALQREGFICGFIDAEHTLTRQWAEQCGVIWDELVLNQEEVFEDQLNWAYDVIKANLVDMMILDSLDATLPRGEKQKKKGEVRDMDDQTIALKARVMSKFFPKISHWLMVNKIGFGIVSQIRTGGIGGTYVHDVISGGKARGFYDTLTLNLRRGAKKESPVDHNEDPIGYNLHIKCTKSKLPDIREHDAMEIPFFYNKGFDPYWSYVLEAMDNGILEMSKQAGKYTTTKGVEFKWAGAKPAKVFMALKEAGLLDDVVARVGGAEIETEEVKEEPKPKVKAKAKKGATDDSK